MKQVVLDAGTLGFAETEWQELKGLGELDCHEATEYRAELIEERCADAEVVFTNKVPFTADTLAKLPKLRYIGVLATGVNNIDLGAAKERGIAVCNVPGYSTGGVVQHTLALILALTNQVARHSESVYNGEWIRSKTFSYWLRAPLELSTMTVGLVGFGDIGQGVAKTLASLGATLLVNRRDTSGSPGIDNCTYCELGELFERSDIVSLHCPLTKDNYAFVNQAMLSRMKPGAFLVNTARGPLIDERALATALNSGHLGGAAVDVVSEEPMRPDNPLISARNLIITPHIAWAGEPSRRRLLAQSIANLEAFLAGKQINRIV